MGMVRRSLESAPRPSFPLAPQFTGRTTFFGRTANLLQQGRNELGHLQRILLTIMVGGGEARGRLRGLPCGAQVPWDVAPHIWRQR